MARVRLIYADDSTSRWKTPVILRSPYNVGATILVSFGPFWRKRMVIGAEVEADCFLRTPRIERLCLPRDRLRLTYKVSWDWTDPACALERMGLWARKE